MLRTSSGEICSSVSDETSTVPFEGCSCGSIFCLLRHSSIVLHFLDETHNSMRQYSMLGE